MTITVRNAPVYVLAARPPEIYLRSLPVYVLATPKIPLPRGIVGKLGVLGLVNQISSQVLEESDLIFSEPQIDSSGGKNSSVVVSALLSSGYRGSITLHYNRKALIDEFENYLESLDLSASSSAHDLIPEINSITGLSLETRDLVDTPVVGSTVTLQAAPGSYFFIPGTTFQIG